MTAPRSTPYRPRACWPVQDGASTARPGASARLRPARASRVLPVSLLTMLTVATGCAAGTAGLVSGDVLQADRARVIVVRGYGLQLRGTPGQTMSAFSIKMIVLDGAPTDPDKARAISQLLPRDVGSVGWEPVTAYPIGRSKLVALLKQPAA